MEAHACNLRLGLKQEDGCRFQARLGLQREPLWQSVLLPPKEALPHSGPFLNWIGPELPYPGSMQLFFFFSLKKDIFSNTALLKLHVT